MLSIGTNGYGERGYDDGCHEVSKTLGLSLLKSSADLGHSDAQYRYGKCLLSGRGCDKDEAAAVRYPKQSADSHNSYAEVRDGACLVAGRGVGKDERLGAAYVQQSADQGNALGKGVFGACLAEGSGIGKDLVRPAEYYKLSADQGNSERQTSFGHCLFKGIGISADPAKGAALTKQVSAATLSILKGELVLAVTSWRPRATPSWRLTKETHARAAVTSRARGKHENDGNRHRE
jgi:TPR repeat protein